MKIASLKMPFVSMALLVATAGCSTMSSTTEAEPAATAALRTADGVDHGIAKVVQTSQGLQVTVSATGMPAGEHAVHVHMTGMCTGPDFTSAGGHWNPMGKQHGMENPMGMHMGDMPNMTVGADGTGTLAYTITAGKLTGDAMAALDADGAAVVIHAKPDDMKSDPAGNAGGRVACGVLTAS